MKKLAGSAFSVVIGRHKIRTYGRTYDEQGNATWQVITTDANGFDDNCWLTTLAQVLKLNLGESPMYANYGIPQYQTIVTQVFPSFYTAQTQTQLAPNFASLTIVQVPSSYPPVYNVNANCHSGAIVNAQIAT